MGRKFLLFFLLSLQISQASVPASKRLEILKHDKQARKEAFKGFKEGISDGIEATLQPITPFVMRFVARRALQQRCLQYGGIFDCSTWKCMRSASSLVTILDVRVGTEKWRPTTPASFRSELRELLQDQANLAYLEEVLSYLKDPQKRIQENLWRFTLSRTQRNFGKSLQRLAVFFQDIDGMGHIEDLEKELDENPNLGLKKATELLRRTNEELAKSRDARLYPDMVNSTSRNLYHFYVIAYLAHTMDHYSKIQDMAFIVPFLLNTTYEYGRYVVFGPEGKKNIFGVMSDMDALDVNKYNDMLQDTYLGYAGALWGQKRVKDLLRFETFTEQFSADPEGYVANVFHQAERKLCN